MTKLRITLMTVAALALAAPVAATAESGKGKTKSAEAKSKSKKGKAKGKTKGKQAELFGNVLAIDVAAKTVTVKVDKASKHGRAYKGLDVVFDVSAVKKIKVADTNADGKRDINDIKVGDRAHAGARIVKGTDVTAPVKANKFHAKAPAVEEEPAPAPTPAP